MIGARAEIGSRCLIGANAVIGVGVVIGDDCSIGPGATVSHSLIGDRVRVYPGARIGQDNVIWKPPGAKPLGFHQDNSYCHWVVPSGFVTCWMALDETSARVAVDEIAGKGPATETDADAACRTKR